MNIYHLKYLSYDRSTIAKQIEYLSVTYPPVIKPANPILIHYFSIL